MKQENDTSECSGNEQVIGLETFWTIGLPTADDLKYTCEILIVSFG